MKCIYICAISVYGRDSDGLSGCILSYAKIIIYIQAPQVNSQGNWCFYAITKKK